MNRSVLGLGGFVMAIFGGLSIAGGNSDYGTLSLTGSQVLLWMWAATDKKEKSNDTRTN